MEQTERRVDNQWGLRVFFDAKLVDLNQVAETARIEARRNLDDATDTLRRELERAIADGDRALHDHVTQQYKSIEDARVAADALERSRLERVEAELEEHTKSQRVYERAREAAQEALKTHIEALFTEKERALDMAATERERAAEVLRDERHRSEQIADTEREKAANALREATARSIHEGDERLREHIQGQVERIAADLQSSEKLEIERISAVEDEARTARETLKELIRTVEQHAKERVEGMQREVGLVANANDKAIQKAEDAQRQINEGQVTALDGLGQQIVTMMPRREVESQLIDQNRQIAQLREDIAELRTSVAVGPEALGPLQQQAATSQGEKQGRSSLMESGSGVALLAIAVISAFVAVIGLILTLTH